MSIITRKYITLMTALDSTLRPEVLVGPRGSVLITRKPLPFDTAQMGTAIENRPAGMSLQDGDFFLKGLLNTGRVWINRKTGQLRIGPVGTTVTKYTGPSVSGSTIPVGTPPTRREAMARALSRLGRGRLYLKSISLDSPIQQFDASSNYVGAVPMGHTIILHSATAAGGSDMSAAGFFSHGGPWNGGIDVHEVGPTGTGSAYLTVGNATQGGLSSEISWTHLERTYTDQKPKVLDGKLLGFWFDSAVNVLDAHKFAYDPEVLPHPLLGFEWVPLKAWVHGVVDFPFEPFTVVQPWAFADSEEFAGYWIHNRSTEGCTLIPSSTISSALSRALASARVTPTEAERAEMASTIAEMEANPFVAVFQVLRSGIIGQKLQNWHSAGSDIKDSLVLQEEPKITVKDYNKDWTGKRLHTFTGSYTVGSSATQLEVRTRIASEAGGLVYKVDVKGAPGTDWKEYPLVTGELDAKTILIARNETELERITELLTDRSDPLADRVVVRSDERNSAPIPIFWDGMDEDDRCMHFVGFGAYQDRDLTQACLQVFMLKTEFRKGEGVSGFDAPPILDHALIPETADDEFEIP